MKKWICLYLAFNKKFAKARVKEIRKDRHWKTRIIPVKLDLIFNDWNPLYEVQAFTDGIK